MVIQMYKLKIKEFRINAGYSQSQMALLLNMSKSYYCDLENGKYPIKLSTLCNIAKIFNVDSSDLFVCDNEFSE
jgi:DNA-binding XRE family transcriptional regulator